MRRLVALLVVQAAAGTATTRRNPSNNRNPLAAYPQPAACGPPPQAPLHLPVASGESLACKQKDVEELNASQMFRLRDVDKYTARAHGNYCLLPQGMWGLRSAAPAVVCKYRWIADLFGLGPGHVVLDWGAGCGLPLDLVA